MHLDSFTARGSQVEDVLEALKITGAETSTEFTFQVGTPQPVYFAYSMTGRDSLSFKVVNDNNDRIALNDIAKVTAVSWGFMEAGSYEMFEELLVLAGIHMHDKFEIEQIPNGAYRSGSALLIRCLRFKASKSHPKEGSKPMLALLLESIKPDDEDDDIGNAIYLSRDEGSLLRAAWQEMHMVRRQAGKVFVAVLPFTINDDVLAYCAKFATITKTGERTSPLFTGISEAGEKIALIRLAEFLSYPVPA